jgi:nitrite reductase (cytochrome c-552)
MLGLSSAPDITPWKRAVPLLSSFTGSGSGGPLLNIARACQTCHRWPEAELAARAQTIQDRTFHLRNQAMEALVGLIGDLKKAREQGKSDAELATARNLQRHAQFRLDFIEAENSMGFHAPQEAARILAESIDLSRQGQIALRDAEAQRR